MSEDMETVELELPEETIKQLEELAKDNNITFEEQIVRIIRQMVEEKSRDFINASDG